MTKPVTGLTTFSGSAPPWSLAQLDADFAALQGAINDLGTYANQLTDLSGTPNVITVNSAGGLTAAYGFGLLLFIKVANTNTSTSVTINLNSLGNVNVVLPSGAGVPVGSLVAGGVYSFIHDGSNFETVSSAFASLLASNNTWTGANVFSGPQAITPGTTNGWIPAAGSTTEVDLFATISGGTANSRIWYFNVTPTGWALTSVNDALNSFHNALGATLTPGSPVITGVAIGNAVDKAPITLNGPVSIPAPASGIALNIFGVGTANTFQANNSTSGSSFSVLGSFSNDNDADLNIVISQVGAATKFATLSPGVNIPLRLGGFSSNTTAGFLGFGPVAAAYVDMTPDKGSFTPTYTGFSSPPPGVVSWVRMGNFAAMTFPNSTGTSNANTYSFNNLPAAITPATTSPVTITTGMQDNGAPLSTPNAVVVQNNGIVRFSPSPVLNFSAWTATGVKGTQGQLTIVYPLI